MELMQLLIVTVCSKDVKGEWYVKSEPVKLLIGSGGG